MPIAFVSLQGGTTAAGVNPQPWSPTTGLVVGQRCILGAYKDFSETLTGITDDGGNTWTQVGSDISDAAYDERLSVWESHITTAATTLQLTSNATPTRIATRLALARFTGSNSAVAGQGAGIFNSTVPNTTDAATSGNITPAAQPGVLYGLNFPGFPSFVVTAGTGFTDAGTVPGMQQERAQYKAISSTSPVAATFTPADNNFAQFTFAVYLQDAAVASSSACTVFLQ